MEYGGNGYYIARSSFYEFCRDSNDLHPFLVVCMTAVTLIELLPSEYVDVFCSVLSRGSVKTSLLGMTCPEITSFFTNCFSKF